MIRRKNFTGINVKGTSILDGETQISPNGGNVLFSWNTRYFASTGNFSIGSQADNGNKLQVNGGVSIANNSSITNNAGSSIQLAVDWINLTASVTKCTGLFYPMASVVCGSALRTMVEIGVGTGGTWPNMVVNHPSAILQADSTNRGFLAPRMTALQRNAIVNPALGLIVYQTDAPEGIYTRKSTGWVQGV